MSLNPKFSIYEIEDIYAIEKPKDIGVKNPYRAVNKRGVKGSRRKNGREIALQARAKLRQKFGCCGEKTNEHTKSTCPLIPKFIVKQLKMANAS